MSEAARTPLYDAHVAMGGRIVTFAGYDLPVQYTGVIAESLAVRNGAGMFDVSHMARLTLSGENVQAYLEHITVGDIAALTDGRGHYSLLPNADGGLVDDIIVYKVRDGLFRMVVNAANHQKDLAHMAAQNTFGVAIEDNTEATAMIAVQGPTAMDIMAGMTPDGDKLRALPMFGTADVTMAGVPVFAARSGYTGEDGLELICPAAQSTTLWNALHAAGVTPCGLGSRDTLRVEAGLPLYGHELKDDLSPLCAGLGWVMRKTDVPFLGRDKIEAGKAAGLPLKLHGIKLDSKRVAPIDATVRVDGEAVGFVSSGAYSPLLEAGVAFAFLQPHIKAETACTVEIRGQEVPGQVVNKRFFKRA